MRAPLLAAPLLLSSVACKPPPQAPAELEELCAYLFAHMADEPEDDGTMPEFEAGVINLDAWLAEGDNLAGTVDGYQITSLDQASVDALNAKNSRGTEELIGAAVAIEHPFNTKELAYATVVADWAEVVPKNYVEYERDFNKGPGCFTNRDCTRLEASAYGLSSWAGLIDVETWNRIEFMWVETEIGWVVAHRSWLTRPGVASWDDIQIHAQYFLGLTMPAGGGESIRLMSTWIDSDYGSLPVSEDYAKSQIVTQMQNQGDAIDEFLEER